MFYLKNKNEDGDECDWFVTLFSVFHRSSYILIPSPREFISLIDFELGLTRISGNGLRRGKVEREKWKIIIEAVRAEQRARERERERGGERERVREIVGSRG